MNLNALYAGLQVANAVYQGRAEREREATDARLRGAQAAASNELRAAGNVRAAARAGLSRFLQSVNNQRRLDASGKAQERAQRAIARQQEAATGNSFEARIRAAEAAGEDAAMSAFSGVAGGAADVIASTRALQTARQEVAAGRRRASESILLSEQLGDMASAGVQGLDTSRVFDSLDFRRDTAAPGRRGSTVLQDVLRSGADLQAIVDWGASLARPGATRAPGLSPLAVPAVSDLQIPEALPIPQVPVADYAVATPLTR